MAYAFESNSVNCYIQETIFIKSLYSTIANKDKRKNVLYTFQKTRKNGNFHANPVFDLVFFLL